MTFKYTIVRYAIHQNSYNKYPPYSSSASIPYTLVMSNIEDYHERVGVNLRRLRLAHEVIDEVHTFLLDPLFPKERADLLIEAEDTAESAYRLMETVQQIVWNEELKKPSNHPEA